MDEEDVGDGVARRAQGRVGRRQRPGRALGIVGRRWRMVGLERQMGIERRPQHLVAEGEGRDQEHGQNDQPDDPRPATPVEGHKAKRCTDWVWGHVHRSAR